ncbi:bestrophin-like domain [Amycolatopsis sp. NPDC004772]
MNIFVAGSLWVAGAAVVAGVIAYLVRRFGWDEGRPDNNDAAGQVFTIVGGLHAVLVAFVLISLFDSVSEASQNAQTEADSLVAATWAADALPAETKDRVHQLAAAYARTVEEQEWPRLADGGPVPATGATQLDQMREAVAAAPAEDDWLLDRKTEASNQLWSVYQAREQRLAHSGADGVGAVVWFALILGSLITAILLPNLFGGTRLAAHIIIVSTLAGTITLLLFAIYQLQNPFSGGAKVAPEAFTSALERLA